VPTDQSLYQEIGKLIRRRREVVGLTQGQLAKAVNISRPAIVNIEGGRQRILVHFLYDLAEALHTSPAALAPAAKQVRRDWLFVSGKPVIDVDKAENDAA